MVFTITLGCSMPQTDDTVRAMPTDAEFLVASCAGVLGALAVAGVGARFTRNFSILACGGVLSGAALALLSYVLWGWFKHGFDLFQVWVPPLAALILLLVMAAQNWFVFYEDGLDAVQSSRPALVMLAAAAASGIAVRVPGEHSLVLSVIAAGAGSLAILLCIDPVQRSIERTRSVFLGILVGICKVLLPLTGIILLLRLRTPAAPARQEAGERDVFQQSFLVNLIGLFEDLGRLALVTLINGARVPAQPAPCDPLELLLQPKNAQSAAGEMPRLKRDSVVMILVLAIHVLCCVIIVKA